MTNFAHLLLPDRDADAPGAGALHLVPASRFAGWWAGRSSSERALLAAQGMSPDGAPVKPDRLALLTPPTTDGGTGAFVVTTGDDPTTPFALAAAAEGLPAGRWRLAEGSPGDAAIGWLLAQVPRDGWRQAPPPRTGPRVLLTGAPAAIAPAIIRAEAIALVRRLVDAPASAMGPEELEAEAAALAARHGATVTVTRGDALATGYPLIHAVGAAAPRARAPRLVEVNWGPQDAPLVAIVGKGISFDTGGLDIKPAAGMALMKKDMGGAAHALALAGLVMVSRWPVRLQLLLPIAENAVGPEAMRPGDILTSRKGLTVEITNTDAEGRLILADALTRAQEAPPALLVDVATLTGAARVALGPDLPALFANDPALAAEVAAAGERAHDPVWPMPLWRGYAGDLKSELADLVNSASGGMAGAVTAALFLDAFVDRQVPWVHLDTFAWNPKARPGRPVGGAALGLLALADFIAARFGIASRQDGPTSAP